MAEKQGIPLSSIEEFPQSSAQKLAELWITTAEEFIDAAEEENGTQGLSEFLGLTIDEVTTLTAIVQSVLPPQRTSRADDIQRFGLGALDEPDEDEPDRMAGAVAAISLPQHIDFRNQMPPVRNQRNRGTCVAFACTAVREFLLGVGSASGDFSEQFLYWDCKQHDNYNGEGTWIKYGMEALKDDGICTESIWQYNPNPIPGNEDQGPPPQNASSNASQYKIEGSDSLYSKGVQAIREKLSIDKLVAFAVPVYTYWFTTPVRDTGDIRLPLSTDTYEGGHAMCMVGYEDDPSVPGGGYFLVRNSWGTGWAQNSTLEPGHARIPYAFIEKYGKSAHTAFVKNGKPRNICEWIKWLFKKLFS